MIFEVCIDSVEGALAAQAAGAQRVELCDNLVEGGVTPSIGMLNVVREQVLLRQGSLGIHVIIRPRGGDFLYSDLEFEVMRQDILAAKSAGAKGVVLGLLTPEGRVDAERTRILVGLARPMSVTFHRAFDVCRDPYEALEILCDLGVDRVLTSGQQPTAIEGQRCIAQLVQQSRGRIIILAGGGITAENAPALVQATGVSELHFSARRLVESAMQHRNLNVFMGKAYQPDEYHRKETAENLVRQVIQAVQP